MKTAELIAYRQAFESELKNILTYWMKFSVEKKGDGFFGAVDLNNQPVPTTNKSCVLNARILWSFSAAAKMYRDDGYASIADRA